MKLLSIFAAVQRFVLRKGVWYWVRLLCLLILGAFASHRLKEDTQDTSLTDLRYWLYRHQLGMQSRAPDYPRRTAIVTIEDDDYWGNDFAGRSPLRRDLLAKILDKLSQAGVNTVVLDVDLRSPDPEHPDIDFAGYRQEDEALLNSIRAACAQGQTIVLGASVVVGKKGEYDQAPSIYSLALASDPQRLSCVKTGYMQLPADMRLVPGLLTLGSGQGVESLSLATIGCIDPTAYRTATSHPERGFHFSRYLSEEAFGQRDGKRFRFSWHDLQQADLPELRKALADRVVLVGGAWHMFAKGQGPVVDRYNSPMGPMPGVFLHANFIEALHGERGTFAPVSDTAGEILEWSLAIVLAVIGSLEIHALWKWGALAISIVISFALSYILLENLGIFLDFLVPLVILIGHTLVHEFLTMREEIKLLEEGGHT
jgi:CHASE2 domain-containing sensor protein